MFFHCLLFFCNNNNTGAKVFNKSKKKSSNKVVKTKTLYNFAALLRGIAQSGKRIWFGTRGPQVRILLPRQTKKPAPAIRRGGLFSFSRALTACCHKRRKKKKDRERAQRAAGFFVLVIPKTRITSEASNPDCHLAVSLLS